METSSTKKLTAIPKIPPDFGEDEGIFYKYYDDLADELDEDMVTSLKSQLDGILIFAGLFAGVNSAFLAFTLPQMSPDPTDDTNALLFQIMQGGNSTIRSTADLPSASFSPPTRTYAINVLFSMSLTLALLGSFLAVLGQQWLVYYRKRSGGGAEYQRWEQLRRYLGAKRWRLELVLDDVLPSVLQVALVIFCVAFILYLGTMSTSLCYVIAAPLCVAGAIIVMTAMCAAWDHWCPFKSPLSHLIQPILKHSMDIIGRIVGISASFAVIAIEWVGGKLKHGEAPISWVAAIRHRAPDLAEWLKHRGQRSADAPDQLKVIALKRVLCTSEDSNAIVHAATNTQSISQSQLLGQILNDDELRGRFEKLDTISFDPIMHQTNPEAYVTIQNTAIFRSLLHMVPMAGSVEDFLHSDDRSLLNSQVGDPEYSNELMKMLSQRFDSFFVTERFPVAKECAECSHCIALEYCIELIRWIPETSRPPLIRIKPNHLKRPIRVIGASKEVGPAWIEAWSIKLSKEWDQISGGEGELTPNAGVRNWQLEKLREFLHLYQTIDLSKFVQTIFEGIATLTVQWCSQPELEVYVGLFEQDLLFRANTRSHDHSLGLTLSNLVTLLHSFERRIRDPATSSDERESQRNHRMTCTEKWITYIDDAYTVKETSFLTEEHLIARHGPLWYHCIEASATLQPYLKWMTDIIQADPGNADNPPMIEMVTYLFGWLEDPEESLRVNTRVESRNPEFKRLNLGEGKIEEYRQFYPAFAKAVHEIESAVAAATPRSSEVETLEA